VNAKFTPEGGEEIEVNVLDFCAQNKNGGPLEAGGQMEIPRPTSDYGNGERRGA